MQVIETLATGEQIVRDMTAEEIATLPQELQPLPDPKLVGVDFQGVMCSATKDDQTGLMAVLLAIQLQGAAFQPTRFEFENGSTLIITLGNYKAFMDVWLPFRQSFFLVAETA